VTHLSPTQIYEWTIGERHPEAERHLQACASCREEILRLDDGLQAFKRSVHQLAGGGNTTSLAVRPRRLSWQWAMAMVIVIGFGSLPLYLDVSQARQDAQTAQDSLLLTQIKARLSQSVPEPMEPLMKLMNDNQGDSQ